MIRVRYSPRCIRIAGHAGSAPKGQDIVCAAVSALYFTLAQELGRQEKKQNGKLMLRDGGDVRTMRFTEVINGDEADHAFEMIVAGMELIEQRYGNYIQVERDF